MRKYLACSLAKCPSGLPVVLFTDERNPDYLEKLQVAIREAGQPAVNGEKYVKKVLNEKIQTRQIPDILDNNYFSFAITNYLKFNAEYHLRKHRWMFCNACDDVCATRNVMHSIE